MPTSLSSVLRGIGGTIHDIFRSRRSILELVAKLIEGFAKRPPLDELHGVIIDASIGSYSIDRHDMRMMQSRGSLCFVVETVNLLLIQYGGEWEDFERDFAIESLVEGLEDDSHAASGDFTPQNIIAKFTRRIISRLVQFFVAASILDAVHHAQAGKMRRQILVQVRVGVHDGLFVGQDARFESRQVFIENLRYAFLDICRGRTRVIHRRGWLVPLIVR